MQFFAGAIGNPGSNGQIADYAVTQLQAWTFYNSVYFYPDGNARIHIGNFGPFYNGTVTVNGNGAFQWATGSVVTTLGTALFSSGNGVVRIDSGSTQGQGWLQWGGEARLDADFSATSNTTLANVTGSTHSLTVSLQAARNYIFHVALLMTTGATAGGIKAAFGGTATVTNFIADGACVDSTTEIAVTRVSTLAQFVANTNAGTTPKCLIDGTFEVNAAGTFTVQFAQNASNATASTVKRGSFMLVQDAP
jgi:hypothetical protein